MKDSLKKPKPTLESLMTDKKVITGKEAIERFRELEGRRKRFEESIEFEQRNRRQREATKPTNG